uniref:Uncharacterized protein n=1 Tax=Proboscia inermis TaxID=420281 RepID=A0A7S0GJU4_9STRA|mmetsp:Transcript_44931/g.45349  ORF Transcript_44931/g.45349 Transcript_44931/m.45349 type:complete len:102 (+) Transcript_44931:42-347(+)
MCDLATGSRCCAFYSLIGAIFMFWVGIMVTKQPFYVGGLDDEDSAKESAFGAMGTFIFTFILSVIGIIYDSKNQDTEIEDASNYNIITIPQRRFDDGVELS